MDVSRFDEGVASQWRRFPPPTVSIADLAAARAAQHAHLRAVAGRGGVDRTGVAVESHLVRSAFDGHRVPVRVYRPAAPSGAGLVYAHGGAFVMGDLDAEDEKCLTFARAAGVTVVSVDYRLAPEHTFPAPLEDCYAVLVWVAENAAGLGIDRRVLGVGGCSAGGALAAAVAQLSQDRGGPALALQLLLYPVLDAALDTPSTRSLPPDRRRDFGLMWAYYLGDRPGTRPPYAAPADRSDLSGLPPACLVTAELDALRDEAFGYAQRLLAAGVPVEFQCWARAPHVFELDAPDAELSRRATAAQAAALRTFLDAARRR
ncbi:alpha/beta hydrolase [Dactylosporangium sucinum]|uniref:Alpha/beta hydrolase fold-3 domain-containing protein n=1 Tax=Dactylosporangium sucinum TaxID=1424081 RepID=A0A917TSW0_9ACTN|nr:alpha/beta hydrolase [Dactylosporangium sucinum]GGM36387.1 hypothetical protein GCM10007977_042230 [Dactylosporangium sucinum]